MIKLTGIKAFEARWQSLKATHPTALCENHLLMQSMGRLVDNYASQSEISAGLPPSLQGLFDTLVDAYLNGYWLEEEDTAVAVATEAKQTITPAMAEALKRRQRKPVQPTAASEAATYIIHDRAKCRV